MQRKIKTIIYTFVILFIFISVLTAGIIVAQGFSDNIHPSDVAIIFGSKVNPNGVPSGRLAARLSKGIELYQQKFFKHIIVSGGTGKEGFDEATVMKLYLIAHQIPAAAIIIDSHGNNTEATAKNTHLIMQQMGFKSALIITQYFHITRARLSFKHNEISPTYNAHANYFEWRDLYSIPREVIAFYDYFLFKK